MFRFGERNWGQDIEYRKQLFCRAMGVKPEDLHGKLILDAGCGSGLLSMELAKSFRMEVVALDLAFGIEQAYAHNTNPFVHYLQASVLEPPVKANTVDFLYCAGVLVAIPDARAGFRALKPILKPMGRYFIWMYHPIDKRHHPKDRLKMSVYNWMRQKVTSRLPIGLQHAIYLSVIPLYIMKRTVFNLIHREKNTTTWREKMQDLTDMFSAVYQHRFTGEEILEWYRTDGLVNAQVAYREEYGFGVRGDSPAPEGQGHKRFEQ
jgi:ubiquinone/menaquinone biosynthesis C-methylase UbiE